MTEYSEAVLEELKAWQREMQLKPNLFRKAAKGVQVRINRMIPERVHKIITTAIKQMTRTVIFGADISTTLPKVIGKSKPELSFQKIEDLARKKIRFYRSTAAAEGAVTGFGGILLGFADLPLWLSIKMKMLFEIADTYGFDIRDYRERVYILHIFQLTFSSQKNRNQVYKIIANWENHQNELPEDINQFDWRNFQLEYRDYIDLAKLLQLIPGIGAVVGAFVNHRLTDKLGLTAMNAYRMRILKI